MPVAVAELIAAADELLEPGRFEDYAHNGLQVPGPALTGRIATGVSANAELIAGAAEARAGLLLVHHGLFWGSGVRRLDDVAKSRLQALFDADMALAAYHLPLDAHPELGNNALLAAALGVGSLERFARHGDATIGYFGELDGDGLSPADLCERLATVTGQRPLRLPGGPELVRRVAIVTGAGSDYIGEAATVGADALITGEPAERATALALEQGVHLIAAGHHATETLGIRRLGETLAERFGLEHVFIDVANPV